MKKTFLILKTLMLASVFAGIVFLHPLASYADENKEAVKATELTPDSPVFDYLYHQLMAKETYIDFSEFNIYLAQGETSAEIEARLIYGAILNEYADVSWSSTCTVDLIDKPEGYYLKALNMSYVEDEYDMDAFYAARDEALALITPEMNELQKALVLHDYLVSKVTYDSWGHIDGGARRNDYKAYGALVEHLAVCEGLSYAYKYLCNQAGLECYYSSSSETQHAWNTIVIDGVAYEVDLVADNPCYDQLGRVWHEAFLISEEKAAEWPGHMADREVHFYNKTIDLPATSKQYEDAFWVTVEAPIYYYKGDFYYTDMQSSPNSRIRSVIAKTPADLSGKRTVLHNIFSLKGEDKESLPWHEGYIIKISDDRIYFATMNTFSSMNLDGEDFRDEYVIDTGDEVIYGAAELDGQVYYTLRNDCFPEGKETYIPLSEEDRVYFPPEPEKEDEPDITDENTQVSEDNTESVSSVPDTNVSSVPDTVTSSVENEKGTTIKTFIVIGCILAVVAVIIAVLSGKKKK